MGAVGGNREWTGGSSDVIRVAIADDHPIVLAGVTALLQSAAEIELVGEAANGTEALAVIRATRPDVGIVDLSMPGVTGLELVARVAESCPTVRLLVLTMHEDAAHVQQMLKAGVRGYVLKRSAAQDLIGAVRAVAAGGMYVDPAVAARLFGAPHNDTPGLSDREAAVLRMTAQGLPNKEIAHRLGIGVKTTETYKARAAEKLGLSNRAEIIRYGISQGWLNLL